MKYFYIALSAVILVALPLSRAAAQATYAGDRDGVIQVGVAYTNSQTDEYFKRTTGVTLYGAIDFKKHLGAEADIHLGGIIKAPESFSESSYDVGLRYIYRFRRYDLYAKGLVGIGQPKADPPAFVTGVPGTYFLYAGGGGLDIRLLRNVIVRAVDFEYQRYPGFPQHALTPSMISIGAAYRFR